MPTKLIITIGSYASATIHVIFEMTTFKDVRGHSSF